MTMGNYRAYSGPVLQPVGLATGLRAHFQSFPHNRDGYKAAITHTVIISNPSGGYTATISKNIDGQV